LKIITDTQLEQYLTAFDPDDSFEMLESTISNREHVWVLGQRSGLIKNMAKVSKVDNLKLMTTENINDIPIDEITIEREITQILRQYTNILRLDWISKKRKDEV